MRRASDDFAAMEKAREDEENGMGGFRHEVAGRRKRKDVSLRSRRVE